LQGHGILPLIAKVDFTHLKIEDQQSKPINGSE
jgi:hypothetical protein